MSYRIQKDKKSSGFLSALNIPAKYHNASIDRIHFSPIMTSWDKYKIINAEKQHAWLSKLLKKIEKKTPLSTKVLVHGRPTDDSSMITAFYIMLYAYKQGYSVKAYNLGFFSKNYENSSNLEYDVLVLYSLNGLSSDYKFDLVRDILRKADSSMVIVVSTAPKYGDDAQSALDFNYNNINFRFNGYLQVDEI